MDRFRIDSEVFVSTGYTDSQLLLEGFRGQIVGRSGPHYLVRDGRGQVTHCSAEELRPLDHALAARLPASPVPHSPFVE